MSPEPTHNAPKTLEELKELLRHDTKVKVAGTWLFELLCPLSMTDCLGVDVDGVLRGKFMAKDKFLSVVKNDGGFGFCSVVFGWDSAYCTDSVAMAANTQFMIRPMAESCSSRTARTDGEISLLL